MVTKIKEGVFWDDEKPFNKQQKAAQQLIEQTTEETALRHKYETCLANHSRITWSEFQLTNNFLLQANFIYNSGHMERDFMGLNNILYTITPISNGA